MDAVIFLPLHCAVYIYYLLLYCLSEPYKQTRRSYDLTGLYSPVVLLLKVADRYDASAAAQGKLVLQRRPLDTGGCTVDSHQDQSGLPRTVLQSPHIGVAVRATSYDAVGLWGPVDSCGHNYDTVFKCQRMAACCNAIQFLVSKNSVITCGCQFFLNNNFWCFDCITSSQPDRTNLDL